MLYISSMENEHNNKETSVISRKKERKILIPGKSLTFRSKPECNEDNWTYN